MFERAVAEAIDAVAAPSVRDRILGLALAWSHLAVVPERGSEVGTFVEGPLARALEHALGPSAAAAVIDELRPAIEFLTRDEISSVRPSWPELVLQEPAPRRTGTNTEPAPSALPSVLVASSDPQSVALLDLALGGVACVEPVDDAVAVLEGLGRAEASLVVVDCRHPTIRAETLVALAPELPQGSRVVIWGEPPGFEQQLDTLGEGIPESFVFCGRHASADDVGAICRILLE